MDTLLRDTTALVEASHTTTANHHRQDTTERRRSPGASRTSDSAAARGAVAARHRALPPGIEAPAKPSPHTPDRTTPGRGTVQTALTRTTELDVALEASRPFAKGEETPPASWRHAGSPVLKVLIPRQRDAAEPSCRLVTLVTVAVQQDPASLTPEAKPAELPRCS